MQLSKSLPYLAFAGAMSMANLAGANSLTGDHQLVIDPSLPSDQDVEASRVHKVGGGAFTEDFALALNGAAGTASKLIASTGGIGFGRFDFSSFSLLDSGLNTLINGTLISSSPGYANQTSLSVDNLAAGAYVIRLTGTTLADGKFDVNVNTEAAVVPVPAAVWLFGSGLMGLAGMRKKASETGNIEA